MNVQLFRWATLAFATALLATPASAQDSRPLSIGVMGGISLPVGEYRNERESAFNITGNVYLRPGTGLFMFRGDVGYERFQGKGAGNRRRQDLNVLSVTANIRAPIGSAGAERGVRPYFVGGGGLYRRTTDIVVFDAPRITRSTNDFGVAFGGGVEFALAGVATFAEARLVSVFGERRDISFPTARWIPVTFGFRF